MKSLFTIASFAGLVSALPSLTTVHQFPNFTWIENMAIRSNGQILGTDVAGGVIYLVDPSKPEANPPIIASFPPGFCIAGITEVEDDVFYTAGPLGYVYNFTFTANTSSLWEVDMRKYNGTGQASVRKVLDMPEMREPNGMTTLDKNEGIILLADATAGLVYQANVKTATYGVFFDDPLLKPIATAFPSFGVNGIRIVESQSSTGFQTQREKMLYFTNTNHGYLGTIAISSKTGQPTGNITLLSSSVPAADDFAVDKEGNVWLCENVQNTLVRVSAVNGTVETIAGGVNSTALVGPVSARFGRGCDDEDVLFVSTDGLEFSNKGVPLTTNGKIVKIDMSGW